ncbi:MAG: UDP-3-O-(3-hydroxymyristoyl)glucosamine N-acyltransferase [Alphaproteobacteria bacterium]|nr:UDP-3-O-(3-hydroxymyristoyl)glucosamine N-acyltransferase [Alphaproteobacteria bacterium]
MADSLFFDFSGAKSLAEIIDITGTKIIRDMPNGMSMETLFYGVNTLQQATPQQVAVFHNIKYKSALHESVAGIIFVEDAHAELCPQASIPLVSPTPYRAFAKLSAAFYPDHNSFYSGTTDRQPIHPSAKIGSNCTIETGATIGENASIGDNCFIGAHTHIGRGVQIGHDCKIASHVTITHALIGNQVVLHAGVRVGQAGFGFHMDKQGHLALPQLGRVLIEDDVDIGANTTVDRGSGDDTIIGTGSRIDNLVMIGHNVQIGKGCVIVAQVGISGSTKIGNHCIIAGQAGLAGHLNIGNGVVVAAQSGILKDIPDGMAVGGSPAVPKTQWHRQVVALKKLINVK